MTSAIPDLWPQEFGVLLDVPPVVILRQQAARLGKKTHNLVEAQVRTTASNGHFVHHFELVAPALDDYIYRLFDVSHPITFYPTNIELMKPGNSGKSYRAGNQEEFLRDLSEVFSSPDTTRIIQSLISQSNG